MFREVYYFCLFSRLLFYKYIFQEESNHPYNFDYGDYEYQNAHSTDERQGESIPQLPSLVDVGRDALNAVASGFDQMAGSLRRIAQNDISQRQGFDFFGFSTWPQVFSSGAWILPTTFLAGGLLFREEIGTVLEEIGTIIENSFVGDVYDTIFGNVVVYWP